MEVEVEDRLPRGLAAAVQKVDPVRVEPLFRSLSNGLCEAGTRCEIVGVDIQKVHRVRSRNHQHMSWTHRIDVHESDRSIVLGDLGRRGVTRNDLAEDAVRLEFHSSESTR